MNYGGGYGQYGKYYGHAPAGNYNPFTDPDLKWFLDFQFGVFQERTGLSATTPSTANGPIGTMVDRRGGFAGIAPSDAARPTLRTTGFNSRPAAQFDGVDDVVDFTTALTAQFKAANYIYVLVAMAPTNEAVGAEVFRITGNATTFQRAGMAVNRGGSAGRLSLAGRILDADATTSFDVAAAFTNQETMIATGQFLCATDTMTLRKNATQIGTIGYSGAAGPASNTNSSAVLLGAGTLASLFYDGLVAGLMAWCRSTEFTAAQLLERERYLGRLTNEVV